MWKATQISQDWTKMFPIIKYQVTREKTKFLHKRETTASFIQNRIKSRNSFLHSSIKISKTSTWNICDGVNRFIQRNKKYTMKRYSMNSKSTHPEVFCKSGVLKIFATCIFAYFIHPLSTRVHWCPGTSIIEFQFSCNFLKVFYQSNY